MSHFLRIIRYLVKTNTTHAQSAYFDIVKSLCSSTEQFVHMEDCSKTLEQPLEDFLKKIKKDGKQHYLFFLTNICAI